ncbi:MAG TPA: N-6 DNA methylase, partial [Puia sp.]|nr:N-6 DNA methylase [Puia sp.]
VDEIVQAYRHFTEGKLSAGVVEEKYSYVAKKEEIVGNDYNLNIPRYVDTFEEEAEIDIAATQKEIDQLKTELAAVEKEMAKYLKELGV